MQIFNGDETEPCTKHSINPVPCILFDPIFDGSYQLRKPQEGDNLSMTPGLSHLAATLFEVMGYEAPEDLNASLIEGV